MVNKRVPIACNVNEKSKGKRNKYSQSSIINRKAKSQRELQEVVS